MVTMDADASSPSLGDALSALGLLADSSRRALYDFVVAQGDWVSRDQAAAATGLRRGNAAHHLDRLAEAGLLETKQERLGGRSGPGAGRPSKLYRRAARHLNVDLPPRDYEFAARLLAEAVDRSRATGRQVFEVLDELAFKRGVEIAGRRESDTVIGLLELLGFEPRRSADGTVVLHNCPFHRLAQAHTELVCGMNLRLQEGLLAGSEDQDLDPLFEPEPGRCCVLLHPRN